MHSVLFVGIGGFFGACSRYLITQIMKEFFPKFPFGTLLSNLLAGFLIGFIIGFERHSASLDNNLKLFLTTGLLGGLSTFSTYSLETIVMIENGQYAAAVANTLLNLSLSLIFVVFGLIAVKILLKA
ncbi:MAG: fluoride efflux transporter CrcB [Deltaproteobacteria bacterium]|jgi:CrcB protein|nr:fluoride efflux transporter CrcB [Deltaproteobacteria bacterium]